MTKHIRSESEKNTFSRSQRMIEAGFKRRDNRETCDDCGALVSAPLLPVHECKSAAESAPSEPTMGAWVMLKFIQRVLETTSPTAQDKSDAHQMCKKLRTIEWEAAKADLAEIADLRSLCCDLVAELSKRDEPCEWMDYEGDEPYEPEDVTASCGWQGSWFGGPPDHCPGCGHPVADHL